MRTSIGSEGEHETRKLLLAVIVAAVFLTGASPPQDRVSFDFAQKNALAECVGRIETSSLEQVNSVWIYMFKIRKKTKKTCIITVDAMTGLIRSNELVSEDN